MRFDLLHLDGKDLRQQTLLERELTRSIPFGLGIVLPLVESSVDLGRVRRLDYHGPQGPSLPLLESRKMRKPIVSFSCASIKSYREGAGTS